MAERKRRVKTGCLTCRQRRVKCDERKPACQRCERANISCHGYQSPREITVNRRISDTQTTEAPSISSLSTSGDHSEKSPLAACPEPLTHWEKLHPRAREVLAHRQYAARTVTVLFRDEHLSFWRDHLLAVALEIEYVYDAIVAIGSMHCAALFLLNPNDRRRGLETRVTALQAYGKTIRQISEHYSNKIVSNEEILIAVLLLLTYFECFAHNAPAAFRHFRAVVDHLCHAEPSSIKNHDVLSACLKDSSIIRQIVLPMDLRLRAPTCIRGMSDSCGQEAFKGPSHELHYLVNFMTSYVKINTAIWSPWSDTEFQLDVETLESFQDRLLRWKAAAVHTFCNYAEDPMLPDTAADRSVFNNLPIPPKPQNLGCMDAAIAAALFNCCMSRTMWMISRARDGDEACEVAALTYVYRNLQLLEGIWRENDERDAYQREYVSCNALKVGFIPLLYLGAQFCRGPWRQWSIGKLRSIGQEGLYNGEAFAVTLESMSLFDDPLERACPVDFRSAGSASCSTARAPSTHITPITIPSTNGKESVAYYVRDTGGRTSDNIALTQVIGRARWSQTWENGSRNLSLDYFHPTHPINCELSETCVYRRIAKHEPMATEWESLLSAQIGLGAYLMDPPVSTSLPSESSGGSASDSVMGL